VQLPPACGGHSTRMVVADVSVPDETTTPMMLME
jgi:hypothetical protein